MISWILAVLQFPFFPADLKRKATMEMARNINNKNTKSSHFYTKPTNNAKNDIINRLPL